jgi:8-oxo-dGTP pyrophosphatase MutT (NUDIX family)
MILDNISHLIQEITARSLPLRQRVEVAVQNKQKEVLITHISSYPGIGPKHYYGFPGGGIERGQNAETAVKNETLEEVGIKIKNIKKLKSIKPFTLEWGDRGFNRKAKYAAREITYSGTNTTYYTADYDNDDSSILCRDNDNINYKFYSISKAIRIMRDTILRFESEDPTKIPIFKARLKVLKSL